MSIDTTFSPRAPTVAVTTAAVQAVTPGNNALGVTSFRIHNTGVASGIIGWALNSASAVAAVPGFAMTIAAGAVLYLELPYQTFFISTGTFEITPGTGGVGG